MQDAHGIILGGSRVDLLTYATSSKLKTGLISMSLAGASFSQESRSAKKFQRNEWTEKPYVCKSNPKPCPAQKHDGCPFLPGVITFIKF